MDVKTCIREAQELKDYGLPMLVVRIGEIYNKHNEGIKLTNAEKLIIGLRYSEFLSGNVYKEYSNDEIDLHNAEIKRKALLDELGINCADIVEMCIDQLNLH